MAFLNEVRIIGNITQNIELKQTPNGNSVCQLSVATNKKYTNKNTGEVVESAEFHNIIIWGQPAEFAYKYAKKGNSVYVGGELQTRDWEDKNGVKRWKTEIVARNFQILTPKAKNDEYESEEVQSKPQPKTQTNNHGEDDIDIEDIPF